MNVKLKDISKNITDGKHGDCNSQEESGYYFISCKDIYDGDIHYENARQITKEDFEETNVRTRLESNDILITNSGTIGRMALVKDNPQTSRTTFQKSVAIIKPNDRVYPSYLYYLLQSKVYDLINKSNGAAQKNLLLSTMRDFELEIEDDIEKQKKISSILSQYDSMIENCRCQIKLLEEAAQRTYREWFVEMRFPGHENVRMEDGLPEGWKREQLCFLGEFTRGKTITKTDTINGDVPVVAGGLEPAYYHNVSNTGSPVITVSGSGANAGFSRLYHEKIWASDCSYLDSGSTDNLYFVYCYLKDNKKSLDNLQKGAAQPHVYAKDINALHLILPTENLLEKFENQVKPYFELISKLTKTIEFAKQSRDLMLPRLMRGEEKI